jgi:hypothetical protein
MTRVRALITHLPPRRFGLAIGVFALAAYAAVWLLDPRQSVTPYLVAYVFWSDVALGSLGLLLIQHVMRSDWGRTARPLLEAGTASFPLLGVLFLPIVFGLRGTYEWAHFDAHAHAPNDPIHKYFNPTFFVVRSAMYFVLWSVLGLRLGRLREQATQRTRAFAGVGLVLLVLSSTFAAIDWVRSLAPEWHSTTFGLYALAGQGVSALAFIVLLLAVSVVRRTSWHEPGGKALQDLAKLMLSFVLLWAYIAFTQFLIVWSGNLPEETHWYVARSSHGWNALVLALIGLHFAVPFLLLLPRYTNRRLPWLTGIAALLLCMRLIATYWSVAPAHLRQPWPPPVLLPVALLGIGGVWLSAVLSRLERAQVGR